MPGTAAGPTVAWLIAPSVRSRVSSFAATAATVFVGMTLVGAGAVLVATGIVAPPTSQPALFIVGAVGGGWVLMLVLFATASITALAVRHREGELQALHAIGATRAQVQMLVLSETSVVAGAAAAAAAPLSGWVGALLLDVLRTLGAADADLLPIPVGLALLGSFLFIVGVAAVGASSAVSMRNARRRSRRAASGRGRLITGVVLVGAGAACGVMTIVLGGVSEDPYDVMMMAGNACILASIGLALISPTVLARVSALARRRAGEGAAGLALLTTARRAPLLSAALGSTVILVGVTVGTLLLVDIDTRAADGGSESDNVVNLINLLVAGSLAVFTTAVLINVWVSVVSQRGAEFKTLRSIGAVPRQLRTTLAIEGVVTSVVGTVLGLLASLCTAVPFSVARGEGILPDGGWWIAGVVAVLACATAVAAAQIAIGRGRFDASGPARGTPSGAIKAG